jgi:hypothetical protein
MALAVHLPRVAGHLASHPPARKRTAPTTRALPSDDDAAPFPFPSDLLGGPASSSFPGALFDRAQRQTLREIDDLIRRYDDLDRGEAAERASTSADERDGARTWTERTLPGGGQSWHREERSERSTPGGYSRSWRSETVAVWGVTPALPPARPATAPSFLSPAVVVAALAAGAYAAIAAAFARRFEAGTTYKKSSKALLVGLWPVLAVVSSPFRRQLRTALATEVVAEDGKAATTTTPATTPQPPGPSQTEGGRTTADSSLRRPDRHQTVDWSREM